jgi:hypothetical protein
MMNDDDKPVEYVEYETGKFAECVYIEGSE